MKSIRKYVVLVMLGLNIGCTPSAAPSFPSMEVQQYTTPSQTVTLTTTPPIVTPTAQPIASHPISTPTFMPVTTATRMAQAHLTENCLEVQTKFPAGWKSSGNVVLTEYIDQPDGSSKHLAYLQNLSTGQRTAINQSDETDINFSISPDRQWMAYLQLISSKPGTKDLIRNLIIADANGHQEKVIHWRKEWANIAAWLDDKRLVIQTNRVEDEPSPSGPNDLVVLNAWTGDEKVLHADFPNMYIMPPLPVWQGWGETVYNPALSHVVYLDGGEGGFGTDLAYILWNIKENKQVARFPIIGDLETFPRWSPQGDRFAFAPSIYDPSTPQKWPSYELLSMDLHGTMTQLTNLSAYYSFVYISDLSWSPDGRQIAFWFSTWEDEPDPFTDTATLSLAVLNLDNHNVTNYCLVGDQNIQPAILRNPSKPPVWSLDGSQLIFVNRPSQGTSRLIMLDLNNNTAVQLAANVDIEGWLGAP